METKSYNENYLSMVAENVGTMFEHAVDNKQNPEIFWNRFINSNVAKQIEIGNVKYLTCSGMDYLREVLNDEKISWLEQDINKDRFYWAGWILAQYQYRTNYSFYKINCNLPINNVLDLYDTLHEADITKFFDVADEYFKKPEPTNLQRIRKAMGLSQAELAKQAGVELRSIQMYEQRKNDINKAQAETLLKLSRVMGCSIEDLLNNGSIKPSTRVSILKEMIKASGERDKQARINYFTWKIKTMDNLNNSNNRQSIIEFLFTEIAAQNISFRQKNVKRQIIYQMDLDKLKKELVDLSNMYYQCIQLVKRQRIDTTPLDFVEMMLKLQGK